MDISLYYQEKGVKKAIQIPIEVGYRLTKIFSQKSEKFNQEVEKFLIKTLNKCI